MTDRLTSYQIALLKEQFDSFDKDGDGKLTKDDTASIMRSFLGQNPTEEEIVAKHNEFDKDGNGTVEFSEFLAAMAKTMLTESVNDEEIVQIFNMLDVDKDGFLNRQELSRGMINGGLGGNVPAGEVLSEEEVNEMLDEYDTDKDGQLSLDEFAKMMKDEIYGNGFAQASE